MSVQCIALAFKLTGVSPSEKLVLLALANYADEDNQAWPSQRTLARITCLSDRTVRTVLSGLEERGIISREEDKRADGSRSTDVITLHLERAEISGGAETASGGVRKQLPGGAETASGLTTFESPINPQLETTIISASAKEDWSSLLAEAKAEAGDALDRTSTGVMHAADLMALVKPRAGEPCTRAEVLEAVRMTAAKAMRRGKPIRSWQWITQDAIELRDRRINATAPPVSASAPRQASLSERIDEADRRIKQKVIDELAREDEARGGYDTNHRSDHSPSGPLPDADHGRRAASELVAGLVQGLTGLSH